MAEEKTLWASSLVFVLAMIGSAVGLGNIWRYPYVAYSNGGGAFLVPYIISIIFMGIPLLFIEYGAGFKFKAGISKILTKINRKFEYIAWYIQLVPFFIVTYYSCIVAWDLLYIPASLTKSWGSNPDTFFTNVILNNVDGFSGLFSFSIYVVIALLIIWFIVWYITHQDINKGLGKANKILIPLLFVTMIFIVFYSFTLPGAMNGISIYLTPQWNTIGDLNIWLAAFGQIFFSLNLGLTIVIAYASYLREDVDIIKSALIVAIANCSFELFTSLGIFGILGYMSQTSGIALNNLITEGTGLAFIAFPQIFNVMGTMGNVIGFLFFTCILFAGITSTISLIEPISLSLINKFGFDRKRIVTYVCIVGCLVSLIYATSAGSSIIGLFDGFLSQFALLLNGLLEIIIIGWIYGLDKLLDGLNKNAKFFKLGTTWMFVVKYIIPILLIILWISGIYNLIQVSDTFSIVIQSILVAALVLIPLVFTKLPAKVDDF